MIRHLEIAQTVDVAVITLVRNHQLPTIISRIVNSLKMVAKILDYRPTSIYTRDILFAIIGLLFVRRSIYELHGVPRFGAWLLMRLGGHKLNIIPISKALERFVNNRLPLSPTIYLPSASPENRSVHIESYHKFREFLSGTDYNPSLSRVILHTGSIHPARGIDQCLSLLNIPSVVIMFVGGTPSHIQYMRDRVPSFAKQRVLFTGHIAPSLAKDFQCFADLLYYGLSSEWPTYNYASSLKLNEYVNSGVPIIGSSGGAAGELINTSNSFTACNPDQTLLTKLFQESENERYLPSERTRVFKAFCQSMSNTWVLRTDTLIEKCILSSIS